MNRSPLGRIRLAQRLQFWLERQFVKGASFQLLAVAGLIGIISVVGGALVLPVELEPGHFGESVWWAFLRLTDPGYLGDDEGVWRRVVSTWLTVSGYVVFLGALVAIMTQWLTARMRQLESGLTPVATRNHIVVLGWSNRTLPVVGEILQSEGRVKRFLALRQASKLRLVILSDEVTPWHAQTLRDDPAIGKRSRNIVLRSGTPLAVDDLERVDCMNAAAVIVPSGGGGTSLSADMSTVKALLSISSHPAVGRLGARRGAPGGRDLPYVVAEIQDHRKVTVARRAYRGPLEIISGNSMISRLIAQNLRHRGLSRVFSELLGYQNGCGIFIREADSVAGSTVADAVARYDQAVLCGVVRWNGSEFVPFLNPPLDFVVEAGDRLVFVAPDYEHTVPLARPQDWSMAAAAPADRRVDSADDSAEKGLRKVLVLGWNSKVVTLIHELETYQGEPFDVTVVSLVGAAAREAALEDFGALTRVRCHHVEADYAVESELRALAPERFDNVLLASSERLTSGEEADTRAVVGYLLLEELLDGVADPPQLLLELQDPDNEPLIGGRGAEVIISPLILAHMVAQVALRRELRAVFDALFTVGGPELTFHPPGRFGLGADSRPFHELAALARRRGETLLGIYHTARDDLILSPPAGAVVAFEATDEFVVMTTYG
ncbi:MAG: ion channel DMI1 [Pseudomonadales bacterium]